MAEKNIPGKQEKKKPGVFTKGRKMAFWAKHPDHPDNDPLLFMAARAAREARALAL